MCLLEENLRNLPLFQRSIGHGQYVIQLHAWRSAVMPTFTTFVSAHSQFVGIKVALAGTDHTHNRFNPALAPDGQPIPGSAIFSPIPGTTRDFVITWNDYHGFSVSEPYWQPTHDLVAMVR